jgi:hypothetical protein
MLRGAVGRLLEVPFSLFVTTRVQPVAYDRHDACYLLTPDVSSKKA